MYLPLILSIRAFEFLISNIVLEKALRFFPYQAYVSHKNDNPNLTQKSSALLKTGDQSVYLITLGSFSNSMEGHKWLFFSNLPVMFPFFFAILYSFAVGIFFVWTLPFTQLKNKISC